MGTEVTRPRRADAERNRRRLLEAAGELFRERGLDVSMDEIARAAGVGHGTAFRHFPTKHRLVAAYVVERMETFQDRGRELLDSDSPADALFAFLAAILSEQAENRSVMEALGHDFLTDEDIRAANATLLAVIGDLLTRAQDTGAVRDDIGVLDVLLLLKGAFLSAGLLLDVVPDLWERQLDLIRDALCTAPRGPLRGRPPSLEEYERGLECRVP